MPWSPSGGNLIRWQPNNDRHVTLSCGCVTMPWGNLAHKGKFYLPCSVHPEPPFGHEAQYILRDATLSDIVNFLDGKPENNVEEGSTLF